MTGRRSSDIKVIASPPITRTAPVRSRAVVIGTIIMSLSMMTAWALDRDDPRSDAAPMDEVNAATTSNEAGVAASSAVSWDLPVTRNDRVEHWIDFLKTDNAKLTERWLERSSIYTPLVRSELRKRGMPEDLQYLAFIESGYNPNAHSHAAAVGLWQFISDTGKRYGLEVGAYVDERRDPYKSTDAALDYLQELYDRFGSWYLAAAAYNTGENRVARVMREYTGSERGTDADFWRIAGDLPQETRNYVPLMLAAGHIAKEPEKFGFDDVDYQPELSFTTVAVPADVPLGAVAKAIGDSSAVIEQLNPELVRKQTPPNRSWNVRVPAGKASLFASNFTPSLVSAARSDLRKERLAEIQTASRNARTARVANTKFAKNIVAHITVRRGETLSEIAQRYRVTTKDLVRANGGLLPAKLKVGQKLNIPRRRAARA